MSKFKVGDLVKDVRSLREGAIEFKYYNPCNTPAVLIKISGGKHKSILERHLIHIYPEKEEKEETMQKTKQDFKVGDRVASRSKSSGQNFKTGILRFVFYDDQTNKTRAVVHWDNGVSALWFTRALEHYQEPLEYSAGEEVRVGDIVYSRYLEVSGKVTKLRQTPIGLILEHYGHEGSASWSLKGDDVELLRRVD